MITGVYKPTSGDVRFAGESIAGKRQHAITNLGIARTFQSLRLFLNMSVKENVKAATYGHTKASPPESILRLPRARREEREVEALAEQALSFFGERLMGYRWDQPAYVLSYANRRRLEIARALATEPRLLLLDEPAAGMNPNETHEVTEVIGRLRDELGLTILVIEHDMHVVEGISDRVVALDHGVKITEGSVRRRSRRTRPWSRRTWVAIPRRWPRRELMLLELDNVTTYYGQMRILEGDLARGRRRRARVPARRQRVREVDDAEDDPRHRAPAVRARADRRRGRATAGRRAARGSRAAWRSCPRTAACSGR